MGSLRTISFFGTCEANSVKTLVSDHISSPFTLKRIQASFAPNCERKLQLDFYISDDSNAPTAARPNGLSVLEDYGQVRYIAGDGDVKEILHEVEHDTAGCYFKVYASNIDDVPHTIDVQVTIELRERS